MSFGIVLLNVCSLFLLVTIIGISFLKWRVTGAIHFGILIFFTFVWSLGTFIELSVHSLDAKLFWRNVTQFGTFFLPVATIVFALAYIGAARRVIRLVGSILYIWQIIPVFLIWTDGFHHLMRVSVTLGSGISGLSTIVVTQTVLGMVCVSVNYALMLAGILILLISAIKMPATRAPLIIIAVGLAIPSIFSSLTNIFGAFVFGGIPADTSFAVGGIIALIGIQYFGFLKLTPIARDRAFDVIDEGILVCAVDGKVMDLNRAARSMLSRNYPLLKDAPASEFGVFLSKTLGSSLPELCAHKELRFNLKLSTSDAKIYYLLRSYELKNDKRLIGFTSVLQDISDDTFRMNRLLEKAEKDPLTGIYNKQAFNEIVNNLLESSYSEKSFLMVFDIDYFKKFNDEYGHLSGDTVIQEVCRRCQGTLREHDVFGRVGGDEFAVLLSGLEDEAARNLADRIRSAISSQEFVLGNHPVSITISGGLANFARTEESDGPSSLYNELFERADAAMYKSKAAGRNRVAFSPMR